MNLEPLKLRYQGKRSSRISCVNLIPVWNELAKSIKLLIFTLGKVHTEKMPSINLFQMTGLCGLMASICCGVALVAIL